MRIWIALFLVLIALPGAAAQDAGYTEIPEPGRVREGGYKFTYFGRGLGDERFTIDRTEDGYEIRAKISLNAGDQVPSESLYVLDDDRRLLRATYKELTKDGVEAEYLIEDGVLIARRTDTEPPIERRVPLEPGAVVTGPHYVTDFFVLHPLGLGVDEERSQPAYAFGFDGWEPTRCTLDSRRTKNRSISVDDEKIDAVVYRCVIDTGSKKFRTRSWLDPNGVSVKITVEAPIGSLVARLR